MKQVTRIALVAVLLISGVARLGWCEEDAKQHWNELTVKAVSAYHQGKHQDGIDFAKQAYAYALDHFSQDQSKMLISNQTLVSMYNLQDRYSDAEPHLKQVIEIAKKMYGDEHLYTLTYMNHLAILYKKQGRYREAEKLFIQTFQLREKVLGKEHKATLASINNLAALYEAQGRYSEAEPLYKQSLQLSEKVLGKEHEGTLISMNNLALLYKKQGRYREAEELYKQTLQLREKVLGKEHKATLSSINNLAALYEAQGRYSEAEPLYNQALQISGKLIGEEHPNTLIFANNLAALYKSQGRYYEAEQRCKQTLQAREKVLGNKHPATLISMNNLAVLYKAQDRYSEAEGVYNQVLKLMEKVLGNEHPQTLETRMSYIALLIDADKPAIALRLLQDQEKRLFLRSFQELYTSSSENVRRLYLQSISTFQYVTLSLASQHIEKEYQQFAAEVMFRWKQVYADESRVQHQLLTLNDDAESRKINAQISTSQAKLSQSLRQQEKQPNIRELIEQFNQDETALLALARHLRTGLEVKDVTLDKVLAALPQDSGLIEYRLFSPVDFKTGKLGERHLAALLLLADPKAKQRFIFRDLGPLAEIEKHLQSETAEAYKRLLGPFDEQISGLKQLYIAPDGPLNLFPFAALHLPDGRLLVERQQINQLQTGRDLLADNSGVSGKGMVAVGGVDYGQADKTAAEQTLTAAKPAQRAVQELFRAGVDPLPESKREVQTIGKIFTSKTNEEAQVFLEANADEYALKHLKQPPRILHLSTHGFYIAQDEKSRLADEAPLLLSGLALAGANNGLHGKLDQHGDDGLLYSLEVLGLNLHGTELVSLSACDTGKGVLDYSEGVYGLVRAFRTAGAKNVLMTLTPVGDVSSRQFMETFYDNWLSSEKNISPAEALHQTRLQFIRDKKPVQDWSPYVLVGK